MFHFHYHELLAPPPPLLPPPQLQSLELELDPELQLELLLEPELQLEPLLDRRLEDAPAAAATSGDAMIEYQSFLVGMKKKYQISPHRIR